MQPVADGSCGSSQTFLQADGVLVYCWIDVNVYRKSTGRLTTTA
jgi:hypothetical protein